MLKKNTFFLILFFLLIILNLNLIAQDLVISPSPLYMGKIPLVSTSEREVTIFNSTVNSININSISISGENANLFAIINNPAPFTLGPVGKREFIIKYSPIEGIMNTAQLNVESSAGSYNVSISGYGVPSSGNLQTFERIIGSSEADFGSEIKHTSDGGFIIVGSTIPSGEEYKNFYLVKTDIYGKVEWSATYGKDNGDDVGSDVIQTSDGGFLAFGTTKNWGAGGTDMMLLKFNLNGEYVWRKTYGSSNNDAGSAIVNTLDGGYALLGQTMPSSGIGKEIYLIKINSDGTKQWEKTFGSNNGADASDLIQLADGSFLIVGYTTIGSDFQIYVIKTNDSGNIIWEKNYGGANADYGYGIEKLADGNFIICGYTASKGAGGRDGYLLKINSNGDLIWDKTFGFEHSDEFKGIVETNNGNLIAVGSSVQKITPQNNYTDSYMVITDKDGNQLKSYLIGGDLNDNFSKIHQTNDGGYITVGSSESYSKSSDIHLIKTDENGLITDVRNDDNIISNSYQLFQNYPNPFNPETTIKFTIPEINKSNVKLKLYDILGNELETIIDKQLNAGTYEYKFNASHLSSGIYFYQLISDNKIITKKMVLLK